jgi:hypothetical protein
MNMIAQATDLVPEKIQAKEARDEKPEDHLAQ